MSAALRVFVLDRLAGPRVSCGESVSRGGFGQVARYELRADEAVLIQSESVKRRDGKRGGQDELVLTNLHLIVLDRGVLGKAEPEYLSLSQVKVIDGRPQALVTKSRDGHHQLEVFFLQRHEVFIFESGGKRAAIKWADAVSAAVNGKGAETQSRANLAIPGTELVVETIRDKIGRAHV